MSMASTDPTSKSGGIPPPPPPDDQGNPQTFIVFPHMPFTKEEYMQFMKNEFKMITNQIKHDLDRYKKQQAKIRQQIEEG